MESSHKEGREGKGVEVTLHANFIFITSAKEKEEEEGAGHEFMNIKWILCDFLLSLVVWRGREGVHIPVDGRRSG